jgi:glycosyltransferase involved in cell wall biosynthesis
MRIWDTTSAARVDHLIANSTFVAKRVEKFWRRTATVIHPPVDVSAFKPTSSTKAEDFYLYAGELASYKRPDIAVDAFTKSGRPLVVIGEGSERKALEARAGQNVKFLGRVPFEVLKDHFARCRALVFPGVEDFGIMPLEVAASGRPTIAFGQGGAAETVVHGVTGILFSDQSSAGLLDGIREFEKLEPSFSTLSCIDHAKKFSNETFAENIINFISSLK